MAGAQFYLGFRYFFRFDLNEFSFGLPRHLVSYFGSLELIIFALILTTFQLFWFWLFSVLTQYLVLVSFSVFGFTSALVSFFYFDFYCDSIVFHFGFELFSFPISFIRFQCFDFVVSYSDPAMFRIEIRGGEGKVCIKSGNM